MPALPYRLGTRSSPLALWQAHWVADLLKKRNTATELLHINSNADTDLQTPLHRMGYVGVFTKALDDALLNSEIDLAVHSLKDVPTVLPDGLVLAAVLPRGNSDDALVTLTAEPNFSESMTIATGSLRRKAQWWRRYPQHHLEGLRGNVDTRLRKLAENGWQGAIFAAAGLERLQKNLPHVTLLKWMIPAPAQGAVGIVCREDNTKLRQILALLNDEKTQKATALERDFMRTLEGGCSAPIGANAVFLDPQKVHFRAILLNIEGTKALEYNQIVPYDIGLGNREAQKMLHAGGWEIIKEIKNAVTS